MEGTTRSLPPTIEKQKGVAPFKSVEPNSGTAFLLIFARNSLFALLNFLFENIFYLEMLSLILLISVLTPFKSQFPSLCTYLFSFLKFFIYFAYF